MGILDAAKPADAGLHKIHEIVLAGSQASLDFQNIPAGFRRLELFFSGRTDAAATTDNILLAFNGDATAANYDRQHVQGTAAAASSSEGISGSNSRQIALGVAASAAAGHAGNLHLVIADYTGSFYKLAQAESAAWSARTTGTLFVRQTLVGWASTAVINRLTLTPNSGSNFVAGTRVGLYGITAGA